MHRRLQEGGGQVPKPVYIVMVPRERLEAYAIDSRFGRAAWAGGHMRRAGTVSVCSYLQNFAVLLVFCSREGGGAGVHNAFGTIKKGGSKRTVQIERTRQKTPPSQTFGDIQSVSHYIVALVPQASPVSLASLSPSHTLYLFC